MDRRYAVVIDAGSTGSRVLGFKFHSDGVTGALRLDDELWVQARHKLKQLFTLSMPHMGQIIWVINLKIWRITTCLYICLYVYPGL